MYSLRTTACLYGSLLFLIISQSFGYDFSIPAQCTGFKGVMTAQAITGIKDQYGDFDFLIGKIISYDTDGRCKCTISTDSMTKVWTGHAINGNQFDPHDMTIKSGEWLTLHCNVFEIHINVYQPVIHGVTALETRQMADKVEVLTAFPNPCNASTQISYHLDESAQITLDVFNVKGERVVRLAGEKQAAGDHSISFKTKQLPNGIYACKLTRGNSVSMKQIILMK